MKPKIVEQVGIGYIGIWDEDHKGKMVERSIFGLTIADVTSMLAIRGVIKCIEELEVEEHGQL